MTNLIQKTLGNRIDFSLIAKWIEPESRVLDLGCGDGTLLEYLIRNKKVKATGVNIDQEEIISCAAKGISVIQQDLNEPLANFKDQSYDYVILSQTLQVVHHPDRIMQEILRVGKYALVSFPNFAYYRMRFGLFFGGKMPKTKTLPWKWYDTPNIHHLTLKDFRNFCKKHDIKILKEYHINNRNYSSRRIFANWFSQACVILISR